MFQNLPFNSHPSYVLFEEWIRSPNFLRSSAEFLESLFTDMHDMVDTHPNIYACARQCFEIIRGRGHLFDYEIIRRRVLLQRRMATMSSHIHMALLESQIPLFVDLGHRQSRHLALHMLCINEVGRLVRVSVERRMWQNLRQRNELMDAFQVTDYGRMLSTCLVLMCVPDIRDTDWI